MRKVTLFTGQWADMPLEQLAAKVASWGYEGLELACWGDHFDANRAATDLDYCGQIKDLLGRHGLGCWALSNHLAGQLVCDANNDERSNMFAPARYANDPQGKREWGDRIHEKHGTRREKHGDQGGQRLHGFIHLAPAVFVPSRLG